MTRRCSHFLVLTLLAGLPVLAGFSSASAQAPAPSFRGDPPRALAAELDPSLQLTQTEPAQLQLAQVQVAQVQPQAGPPVVGNSSSSPPASTVPGASTVRPTGQWVQAFRPTVLWSSEHGDATNLGELPQWSSFRQLGPHVKGRMPVAYPGDGVSRLPQQGWVSGGDLGTAGTPNPDHELNAGGYVSPTTNVMVPRRTVQAWPQGISAQYAAVVDGDSGEVLWGRNAHGRVAPASLTKIVTSLVALERSRLTDRVGVRVDSREMYDSTVMGLIPGDSVSMETLLFGLMLPSGNDAAIAIAQHVAGSERAFNDLMNAKAAELGLVNSRFVNAHGLDAEGHYSSPYDLATFARVGMGNQTFFRLASTQRYEAEGHVLHNLNRLIGSYPKADGVKVGYTDAAGRAIVASATNNGRRVFVTLIRSHNPTAEAQALLEWTFRGFVWQ
jgi:hypothetical protein